MKTKLKKYYPYPIYLIMTIAFSFMYYYFPKVQDDIFNSKSQELHSWRWMLDTNASMYSTWSDRIIINPWMFICTNDLPKWLYSIITAIITMIIIYFLNHKLIKHPYLWTASVLAALTFPVIQLSTAGYIATTVTYIYPVSLICLSIMILETNKWYLKIITIPLLLFSFNNEQLCICTGVFLIYYIIRYYKKWRIYLYPLVPWIIDLAIAIHSPGNHSRALNDTHEWLPKFVHFTFFDKINVGMITTIQHYLFGLTLPIILLSLFLLIKHYQEHKILAWIPLTIVFATNCVTFFATQPDHWATTPNPTMNNIAIVTYLIGFIWLLATLYLLNNLDYIVLLLAGLAARCMLGFSPTIYISSTRTFMFCDLIMIYLTVQIIIKTKWQQPLTPIMILLMAASLNAVINYAIITQWNVIKYTLPPIQYWYIPK